MHKSRSSLYFLWIFYKVKLINYIFLHSLLFLFPLSVILTVSTSFTRLLFSPGTLGYCPQEISKSDRKFEWKYAKGGKYCPKKAYLHSVDIPHITDNLTDMSLFCIDRPCYLSYGITYGFYFFLLVSNITASIML